jgi:hypothetical protein
VSIPAGALPSDVTITVAPAASNTPTGSVGTVYEIGPSGTQFSVPVTMTFKYAASDLAGHAVSELRAGTVVDGKWSALASPSTNTTASTVSGTTTHLSPYGIFFAASTGGVCVQRAFSATCAGVPNAGAGDGGAASGGSSGGAPIDSDASVGPPASCAQPTCANPTLGTSGPCDGYPGATMTSCTDGANGISVTCCFAEDAPTCVSAGGGCAVSGSPGGDGGGGNASCTPPSCEDICKNAIPGASNVTVGSCNVQSNSSSASCCLPPGTPLPSSPIDSADGGVSPPFADAGTGGGGGTDGGTDTGPVFDGGPELPPDGGTGGGTDGGGGGADGGAKPACTPSAAFACPTDHPDAFDCPANAVPPEPSCTMFGAGPSQGETYFCCAPSGGASDGGTAPTG